jgi:Subtilase family
MSKKPGRVGVFLAILLGCGLFLQACGPNPTAAPTPAPQVNSNLKISSILLNLFTVYQSTSGTQEEKTQAVVQYARENRFLNQKDEAEFALELDDPAREQPVVDKIKAMGGTIRNSSNLAGTVTIQVVVPLKVMLDYASNVNRDNFLADLAAFEGVKTIDLITKREKMGFQNLPQTPQALEKLFQASKNEGVKQMGADKWHAAGFKGRGVRIGVIDGGFKYYRQFLGSTLPRNLEVKDIDEEFGGSGVVDEDVHGTAVVEIIYSLAPEATIIAAAVDGSDNQFKSAIDYLVAQNVSIISVSMGGHATAGDGSAPLDRYIEQLRKDKGIVFLFSSGNEAASHYVGFYNPDNEGFHQFIPGVNQMAIANNSSRTLQTNFILNWEQWKENARNDLDIFVTDSKGNPLKASQSSQASRPPVEYLPVNLPARSVVYVKVRQKPGSREYTKPFRLHIFGHNTAFQFIVPQMAVGDPATSKGALAVGATQWDEDKIAYYSSQGPLTDGRFKPEIVAPAGVSSRSYEEDGGDVFDGTSASCPQAAGVAAILKGANPNMTADQLENLLKEAGKDLTPGGPDYANGYGRLDIGGLAPSNSIAPRGTAQAVPNADIATLQFPVEVLATRSYPAPNPQNPSVFKGIPQPLPTRSTSLKNGATDASKPAGTSGGNTTEGARPTVAPNTEPTVEPVSGGQFRDDFRTPGSGLPNAGDTIYQNGRYVVKAAAGKITWSVYPPSVMNSTNFNAEVTVQGISGRNGLYGLVFWHKDANNYYLLSVAGDGQYQITRYQNNTFTPIMPWGATPGWKNGQNNTIRLVSSKGTLQVYLNGQVGRATQANGEGAIGFAAASFPGGSAVEAAFTDFRFATAK